jgi:hypothetical protein
MALTDQNYFWQRLAQAPNELRRLVRERCEESIFVAVRFAQCIFRQPTRRDVIVHLKDHGWLVGSLRCRIQ